MLGSFQQEWQGGYVYPIAAQLLELHALNRQTADDLGITSGTVAVRKDDAPAAVQAAMTNVVGLG